MILYHGSNTEIKEINLAMCRPYKDFGQGFYLTVMKEQAEKMAIRVARIYGGAPVLNVYNIDDDFMGTDSLNIKDFGTETSEEWARFVRNNRSKTYTDFANVECNLDNKYDIVIGPIADDDMALLFRQYENGVISFENMLTGMIYKKTTNQYSFHTQRAISLLRKVGV
ncbi:DUF3990 domain-containing protein [Butyrivibrio sp. M55]|uniref:DUF3990 domain-containing protein n=1 Tax=Butyrivibrio sp. M55 TaxID=1855323 RepID=UPI0008F1F488|nr:DUF3990 domain-containing protein [Butyrivibrio sp. M55]SFU75256.1 Protein of unknown function [Butyrivibrio sp. M55]